MHSLLRKIERYNKNHHGKIRSILIWFEFGIVILSFPLIFLFSINFLGLNLKIDIREYSIFSIILLISWYIQLKINSQAKVPRTQRYTYLIFNSAQTFFIGSIVVFLFKFIFGLESLSSIFILTYLLFVFFITLCYRILVFHFLKMYRSNGYNLHHVLIIAEAFSDQIIEKLIEQKEWGFKIKGIVTDSKLINVKFGKKILIISEKEDLRSIIDNNIIDEIIYCKSHINEDQIKQTIQICDEVGIVFRLQSSISPIDPLNFQLKTLNKIDFLNLVDSPSNNLSSLIKSISDFYVSILAMIFLSPLFCLIALLVKLDSKGPIFFKQERIGLRGRKFMLYKFRTMIVDAENKLEELKAKNESDGPVFKIKNDPRITRIGRFLRKTSLDELPQLQNVILGEMSLIGPRPPIESEVKQYERWQLRRLSVKPGITCSWQVTSHRNDVKFENWMKMDLSYIDNWSLSKDFQLLFKTMLVLFFAEGR